MNTWRADRRRKALIDIGADARTNCEDAVPMEFERLVESSELSNEVRDAISQLLTEKRTGGELSEGPKIRALDELIVSEFTKPFEDVDDDISTLERLTDDPA